jgi:hypothetical protein
MTDPKRLMEEVLGLLETERHLLCAGALDRLPELGQRKEVLIARLAGMGRAADEPGLRQIRDRALANLRLFEAAQQGLRDARTRLDRIRAGARGFASYDHAGRRAEIGQAPARHERKA